MGDHLALIVDRLLTESTLEAAIGGGKRMVDLHQETVAVEYCHGALGGGSATKVECRICQEEDWDTCMEAPCACCGSLKYAHRKCIQRWCNEKGDTMCEICLQQFRPGYTSPQQLFHYGSIPMNFRGNWEIARQDLNDSQIITMMPTERDFMDNYDDYFPIRTRSSTLCCRTIAIIFMALLVLRHTLPLMIGDNGEYSLALFALLVLRTAGNPIPNPGDGESIGKLPPSTAAADHLTLQESQEAYISSSESEEEDEEEEEEDTVTNSAHPNYSQPRFIPVY
ncbi:uncharacterized protein [Miscanthus floridulus]